MLRHLELFDSPYQKQRVSQGFKVVQDTISRLSVFRSPAESLNCGLNGNPTSKPPKNNQKARGMVGNRQECIYVCKDKKDICIEIDNMYMDALYVKDSRLPTKPFWRREGLHYLLWTASWMVLVRERKTPRKLGSRNHWAKQTCCKRSLCSGAIWHPNSQLAMERIA